MFFFFLITLSRSSAIYIVQIVQFRSLNDKVYQLSI